MFPRHLCEFFSPLSFSYSLVHRKRCLQLHATVQLMPRRTILQECVYVYPHLGYLVIYFWSQRERKDLGFLGFFCNHLRLTPIQVSNCCVEALHVWIFSKQVFGRNTRKPRAFFLFRSFVNLAVLMNSVKEKPPGEIQRHK